MSLLIADSREIVVNSYGYCMMFFLFFMVCAVLITILAYRKCKKLDLSPPLSMGQSEQFRFFKFLNDHAKSTEYKSLRPFILGLWFSFLMCFVAFIKLLLE